MAMTRTAGRLFKARMSFRLRTLLLLVVVVAIGLGWEANIARRRMQAVRALSQWAALLRVYDDKMPFLWVPEGIRDSLPDGIRQRLFFWFQRYLHVSSPEGSDLIVQVVDGYEIPVIHEPIPEPPDPTPAQRDEIVAAIACLKELKSVQVPFELTDENLRTLSCLTELDCLGFETQRLTDAGVAQLTKLPKLRSLGMYSAAKDGLSPELIIKLNTLPDLEELLLGYKFGNEDVARMKAALPRVTFEIYSPVEQDQGQAAHPGK